MTETVDYYPLGHWLADGVRDTKGRVKTGRFRRKKNVHHWKADETPSRGFPNYRVKQLKTSICEFLLHIRVPENRMMVVHIVESPAVVEAEKNLFSMKGHLAVYTKRR